MHPGCWDPVPGLVENITLSSHCIQDNHNIVINFSWSTPSVGSNDLAGYYVCVNDSEYYSEENTSDALLNFCEQVGVSSYFLTQCL